MNKVKKIYIGVHIIIVTVLFLLLFRLRNFSNYMDLAGSHSKYNEEVLYLSIHIKNNAFSYQGMMKQLENFSNKEKIPIIYEGLRRDEFGRISINYYINQLDLDIDSEQQYYNYNFNIKEYEESLYDTRYKNYGNVNIKFITKDKMKTYSQLTEFLSKEYYENITILDIHESLLSRICSVGIILVILFAITGFLFLVKEYQIVNQVFMGLCYMILILSSYLYMLNNNALDSVEFYESKTILTDKYNDGYFIENISSKEINAIDKIYKINGVFQSKVNPEILKELYEIKSLDVYILNEIGMQNIRSDDYTIITLENTNDLRSLAEVEKKPVIIVYESLNEDEKTTLLDISENVIVFSENNDSEKLVKELDNLFDQDSYQLINNKLREMESKKLLKHIVFLKITSIIMLVHIMLLNVVKSLCVKIENDLNSLILALCVGLLFLPREVELYILAVLSLVINLILKLRRKRNEKNNY